jgi:hypothetical protein
MVATYPEPAKGSLKSLMMRLLAVGVVESREWGDMGLRLEAIANKRYLSQISNKPYSTQISYKPHPTQISYKPHPTQISYKPYPTQISYKPHPTQEVGLRDSLGPPDLRVSELEIPESEQEDSEPRIAFRNSIADAESMERSGTEMPPLYFDDLKKSSSR